MTKSIPLSERPAWKALQAHHQQIQGKNLKQMFAEDPQRGERFTVETGGIFLDYSKNRITVETVLQRIQHVLALGPSAPLAVGRV